MIESRIEPIGVLRKDLLKQVAHYLKASDGFTQVDLFLIGATNRTIAQVHGFRDLILAKNFLCAGAILRMQIDTSMRIFGLSLVPSAEEPCGQLLAGRRYNQLKDRNGKRLNDSFLRDKLSQHVAWINSVYESTSDLVHLSPRHFYNSIERIDETGNVSFRISGQDKPVPDEQYFEIIDGFYAATELNRDLILASLRPVARETGQ